MFEAVPISLVIMLLVNFWKEIIYYQLFELTKHKMQGKVGKKRKSLILSIANPQKRVKLDIECIERAKLPRSHLS